MFDKWQVNKGRILIEFLKTGDIFIKHSREVCTMLNWKTDRKRNGKHKMGGRSVNCKTVLDCRREQCTSVGRKEVIS